MKPNKIILVNIPNTHCEEDRYHLTPKTFAQSGDGGETREEKEKEMEAEAEEEEEKEVEKEKLQQLVPFPEMMR